MKILLVLSLFCILGFGCKTGESTAKHVHKERLPQVIDLDEWKQPRDPSEPQLPMSEVNRLSIACALLDVPRNSSDWRTMVGLPETVKPSWGALKDVDGQWTTAVLFPLRRELDDSIYALKVYHTVHTPQLVRVHLVLFMKGRYFIPDPHEGSLEDIDQLKEMMREARLTPAEFTKDLPVYLSQVIQKRPNK
jgi:hypothetical protein